MRQFEYPILFSASPASEDSILPQGLEIPFHDVPSLHSHWNEVPINLIGTGRSKAHVFPSLDKSASRKLAQKKNCCPANGFMHGLLPPHLRRQSTPGRLEPPLLLDLPARRK